MIEDAAEQRRNVGPGQVGPPAAFRDRFDVDPEGLGRLARSGRMARAVLRQRRRREREKDQEEDTEDRHEGLEADTRLSRARRRGSLRGWPQVLWPTGLSP